MNVAGIVVTLVAFLLVVPALIALVRFLFLRSRGLPVAVRRLPAVGDGAGWRHGVLVLTNDVARMYKIRSVRPYADFRFSRSRASVTSRRDLTEIEAGIFAPRWHIVTIGCGTVKKRTFEFALDDRSDTALVAWIESSPSVRQTRKLPVDIERRFREVQRRGSRRT